MYSCHMEVGWATQAGGERPGKGSGFGTPGGASLIRPIVEVGKGGGWSVLGCCIKVVEMGPEFLRTTFWASCCPQKLSEKCSGANVSVFSYDLL